jgi:hypothetical protein
MRAKIAQGCFRPACYNCTATAAPRFGDFQCTSATRIKNAMRYNPGVISTAFDHGRWCVRVAILAMVFSCCGLATLAAAQSQVVDVTVHSAGLEQQPSCG